MERSEIEACTPTQWLSVAWRLSSEGVIQGRTTVLRAHEGLWWIACDGLETVSEVLGAGEVMLSLRRWHAVRPLPNLRRFMPVPPNDCSAPMHLLKLIPYKKMPQSAWIELAWRIASGESLALSTELVSIRNGVWCIQCKTEEAVRELSRPEWVIRLLGWLSQWRALPNVRQVVPMLGALSSRGVFDSAPSVSGPRLVPQKTNPPLDCDAIPEMIDDERLRRSLSHFYRYMLEHRPR